MEDVCGTGADVGAIAYRSMMLQFLEMACSDQLAAWNDGGVVKDAVFRLAGRVPTQWLAEGVPQSEFPFDVDLFFRELQLEST